MSIHLSNMVHIGPIKQSPPEPRNAETFLVNPVSPRDPAVAEYRLCPGPRVVSAPDGLTSYVQSSQRHSGTPLRRSPPLRRPDGLASLPHRPSLASFPSASCEGRKVPATSPLGHRASKARRRRLRRQAAHLLLLLKP